MKENEFLESLVNAYVDETKNSLSSFSPQFIYNCSEAGENRRVLDSILDNLRTCDEFLFSVAFITDSGVNLLKLVLREMEQEGRHVKGRIMTSNYLSFTQPKALKALSGYQDIETRMFYIHPDDPNGFHTKGYIFRFKDNYKAIIGSSNLTARALTTNNEWNNLIVSRKCGQVMHNILGEFERLWHLSLPLSQVFDRYEKEYLQARKERENNKAKDRKPVLEMNAMQQTFVSSLDKSIKEGKKRGLLISATGTGKTYAAAFGVRSIKDKVKKLLFVTHRETILLQARETFLNVFQEGLKTAIFSGSNHDVKGADFVFATLSSLSKEEYLSQFGRDEFDFVIIDECHRISEDGGYQKIIDHFNPMFLLGMSATPDRTDGYDLYKLFDHNILYEIRLYDALQAEMLVPFHYFGITDLSIDGKPIDDKTQVRYLACEERARYIVENSRYYGYSGDRLRALVFVSRKEEAEELSGKISLLGIRCVALSGKDDQRTREKYISMLEEKDTSKEYLEMILTVDIFNEGVDIPSVNQVIFLRPTKSSIVFIQQLGRGLRKNRDKEYLTVLDFIANYDSNFLISTSFSPKGSGSLRQHLLIHPIAPGPSVIQFDEISKKRILSSLACRSRQESRLIDMQFTEAKNRMGRIPTLIEFDKAGEISGRVFLDKTNGRKSYYQYLLKEHLEDSLLSSQLQESLIYLSRMVGPGLRIHEALLLKTLIDGKREKDFVSLLPGSIFYDMDVRNSVFSVLDLSFSTGEKKTFPFVRIQEDEIVLSKDFSLALLNPTYRKYVMMILDYALYSHRTYFEDIYDPKDNFVLYEKYTRRDVCQLINHTHDNTSTIYGYQVFRDLNVVPIFVSYNKLLDKDASTNYLDQFENPSIFHWDSRSNRTLQSNEIQSLIHILKNKKGRVYLFIQRENMVFHNGSMVKSDDTSFYFLGQLSLLEDPIEATNGDEVKTNVVKFLFQLRNPVRKDIYDCLTMKPLIDKE